MIPAEKFEAGLLEYADGIRESLPEKRKGLFSDAVIQRAIKKADLPEYMPPLFAILPMADGRLLVARSVDMKSRICDLDLFSKEGKFVRNFQMADMAVFNSNRRVKMTFRGDYAYSLKTDAKNATTVVRYKVL